MKGSPRSAVGLLVQGATAFLRIFAVDKRSLALFRIGIGLLTLYDLNLRFPDIHNHYSDRGIISRSLALDKFQNYMWISVHMIAGTDFYTQLIFLLHGAIAISMALGYRTRLSTFLNWVMVCSLQNRNYIVCHSGDTLHRVILFWACLLPLGDVFSLDSLWAKKSKKEQARNYEVLGPASMGIIVQIYIMYVTAHFHKSSPEWRTMGTATWMALQLDFFRTPIGDIFNMSPWLCQQLTFFVLYWQVSGVIIYFVPVPRIGKYLKAFSVFGYMCMHLGFGMCLDLETFTWVTEAALLALIPGWVWDEGIKFLTRNQRKGLHIYYLRRCKFCTNLAEILGLCMLPNTKVVPVDTLPVSHNHNFFGISVVDANRVQITGPDALEAIVRASPILFSLSFVLRMKAVKSLLYKISQNLHHHEIRTGDVSLDQKQSTLSASQDDLVDIQVPSNNDNNYNNNDSNYNNNDKYNNNNDNYNNNNDNYNNNNGGKEMYLYESPHEAGLYADVARKKTFRTESVNMYAVRKTIPLVLELCMQLLAAFTLVLILTWNAGNISFHALATPPSLKPVMWVTQLDQYWGMFAPRPPDVMWWYNIEAELDDGTKAELFNDGALFKFEPHIPHTFDKPKNMHVSMGNHRWFKLFENGLNSHESRDDLRLNFGRWICREYNNRHFDKKRLYKYSIHWMNERVDTVKQDGTRYLGNKQTIWNHICFDK